MPPCILVGCDNYYTNRILDPLHYNFSSCNINLRCRVLAAYFAIHEHCHTCLIVRSSKSKVAAAHCLLLRYSLLTFLILSFFPVTSAFASSYLLSRIRASNLSFSSDIILVNPEKGTQKMVNSKCSS